MAHRPFNLYKRPTIKNGKFIYYVQFYDEYDNRLIALSTGQSSKAAAENWAYDKLNKGIITTEKNITFEKFAEDWWIGDKCPYIKGELARGASLSRAYCDHALTCLNVMLKKAVRQEYLHENPAAKIKRLKEDPKEKGILTIEEVKALFRDEDIERVWNGNLKHFTLNLLSASTGMRMGEVQALQVQHIHEKYISVIHSWDRKYGLKEPKRNSKRSIPVPSKTGAYLQKVINASTFTKPDDLIFFGKDRTYPVRNEAISKSFYKALISIGISEEERKARNITFHSWRFLYNTLLRGRISEIKLRRLTGHRTEQMSDWYTRFDISDYQDALQIQEEYFNQ